MKKVLSKILSISFPTFLVLFSLFFLYEYGSRALNYWIYAERNSLNLSQLFEAPVIGRKIGSVILYTFLYPLLLWGVYKKNKTAFIASRIIFIMNSIFAPISKLFFLVLAISPPLNLQIKVNPTAIILQSIILFMGFFYCFLYIGHYWKLHEKKKARMQNH